ncbi:MAG: TetR/AcrR family transcriptional regulator [Microthrixaceae bacterium]
MTTTAAPRANQREHILDEALKLMSAQGSAGMSMRQLALACGVQVAAIYHYFPSKEALLESVFEERRYATRLAEEEDLAPIPTDASASERLRAVFEKFWNGMLGEEEVIRLLLGEALRNQPYALPTGTALLDVFRSGVQVLLAQHVPELHDVDAVTELFVAQIFAGFIQHIFDPEADTDRIAAALADTLVRTVAT